MNRHTFAAAAGLARAWVWVYTLPLDPVERDDRRREIASDLWECAADCGPTLASAAQILVRTLLGVLDDLLWTGERLCAGRHMIRPLAILRVAIGVVGVATVAVSASGPALDPAQTLKVTIVSAGWVDAVDRPHSGFAPAVAFTLTNTGDQGTAALDVNAVFHRPDDEGDTLGLGTAFAPIVGWHGLAAGATSPLVFSHGQPSYVIDALTSRTVPVPFNRLDEVHVRLFVHHRGRWTLLGDFKVPCSKLTIS